MSLIHVATGGWQLSQGHDTTRSSSSSSAPSSDAKAGEQKQDEDEAAAHDAAAVAADMRLHVEAGITAVDCGDIYTGVEGLIGKFLRDHRPTWMAPQPVQVGGWVGGRERERGREEDSD